MLPLVRFDTKAVTTTGVVDHHEWQGRFLLQRDGDTFIGSGSRTEGPRYTTQSREISILPAVATVNG
ncbi:MAG TPA: hypothetical protein VK277_11370 [Acidimicrobiales bacterium]|nr:hypothetical protein [Acidimicrobiales bacterium]